MVDIILGEMFRQDVGHIEFVLEFVDDNFLERDLLLEPKLIYRDVTDFAQSSSCGNGFTSGRICVLPDVQSHSEVFQ